MFVPTKAAPTISLRTPQYPKPNPNPTQRTEPFSQSVIPTHQSKPDRTVPKLKKKSLALSCSELPFRIGRLRVRSLDWDGDGDE